MQQTDDFGRDARSIETLENLKDPEVANSENVEKLKIKSSS